MNLRKNFKIKGYHITVTDEYISFFKDNSMVMTTLHITQKFPLIAMKEPKLEKGAIERLIDMFEDLS